MADYALIIVFKDFDPSDSLEMLDLIIFKARYPIPFWPSIKHFKELFLIILLLILFLILYFSSSYILIAFIIFIPSIIIIIIIIISF